MMKAPIDETLRVREVQNKNAPKYDRQMNFFDRVLFSGGREWACSQAEGKEIAVGTGRNLAHYPAGVKLTAIEFSPEMLGIARKLRRKSAGRSTCARAMPRR